MSQPIVIPPQKTPEARFAEALQNPATRARAARDPIFASRLMESFKKPLLSQGPAINPYNEQNYILPPPTTYLSGAMGVAPEGVSVADQIRMQRDRFLIADGAPVTGDYTARIRKAKGGLPAPSRPAQGYAGAFYPYPDAKMRTGAALAASPTGGGVMETQTRGLLPTTGFNPGVFVATRPDSLNRSLDVNVPVPMPRQTVRGVRQEMRSTGIVTSSPADDRRRAITTLLGLGATAQDPRRGDVDAYALYYDFVANSPEFNKLTLGKKLRGPYKKFLDFFQANPESRMNASQLFDIGKNSDGTVSDRTRYYAYVALEALKTVVRAGLGQVALAQKLDFNKMPGISQALKAFGVKDANKKLNEFLLGWMGDDWQPLLEAMGAKFPLDLDLIGQRRFLLRYLYRRVWGAEPSVEIYNALNAKLACSSGPLGNSINGALSVIMTAEFAPGRTPAIVSCAAAKAYAELPAATGEVATEELVAAQKPKGQPNKTLLKAGIFGGVALLAVGLYAKTR